MCRWCDIQPRYTRWAVGAKAQPGTANRPPVIGSRRPQAPEPPRAPATTLQWGLSADACATYLGFLVNELTIKYPAVDRAFVSDFAKLYSVMKDTEIVLDYLDEFDRAMAAARSHQRSLPETSWLTLSAGLSHYEVLCWFPNDVLLPMGILPADEFFSYIRRGHVLKDYGAGVKHGEFTHRFQWHVIMAVITDGFTTPRRAGWDHTPFELYTALGKGENRGLWNRLFDQSGDGFNEGDGGGFSHPDWLHAVILSNSGRFPTLAALAARRETKRRHEFVDAICKFVAHLGEEFGRDFIPVPGEFANAKNPYASHNNFKEFDYWFAHTVLDKFLNQPTGDGRPAKLTKGFLYNAVSHGGALAYKLKKINPTPATRPPVAPKRRTAPYTVCAEGGNVYKLTNSKVLTEAEADRRAKDSRVKLFRSG